MNKKLTIVVVFVLIAALSFPDLSNAMPSAKCRTFRYCWFMSCQTTHSCLGTSNDCQEGGSEYCGCCDEGYGAGGGTTNACWCNFW